MSHQLVFRWPHTHRVVGLPTVVVEHQYRSFSVGWTPFQDKITQYVFGSLQYNTLLLPIQDLVKHTSSPAGETVIEATFESAISVE